MEKAMTPHSSILAWKIPCMEEPGRLQSMGLRRVRYDWATLLSLFTFMHWRRKWQPIPVFLPGESQGQGSWMGCHLWVAQSWTRLKWFSSSRASLIAQLVKNPPAMQETWVWSLGWEDPLEKRNAIHSSILTSRIPRTGIHGVAESRTWLSGFHFRVRGAFV